MTTYADVLSKKMKQDIKYWVKRFGYSDNVKIKYDLPLEDKDKPYEKKPFELCFIVQANPGKSVHDDIRILLKAKLAEVLGCEIGVQAYEHISKPYRCDTDIKSASIDNERAIKEVIYRVNHGLSDEGTVPQSGVDAINFADIVCKNFEGKSDISRQKILLEEAEEYLKQHPQKTQNANNEVAEQAKKRHKSDAELIKELRKERSPARPNAEQSLAPPNGHGTSPPNKRPFS